MGFIKSPVSSGGSFYGLLGAWAQGRRGLLMLDDEGGGWFS
jgi:hypothetical protein